MSQPSYYTSNWFLQRLKKCPIKYNHHYLTNLLTTDKRPTMQGASHEKNKQGVL